MGHRYTVHRYTIEQRFDDLDLLGHVNNVAYLVYLQEVRLKLLADLIGFRLTSVKHVVVRNEIDYVRALGYRPEPLPVDAWISRVGGSSYDIGYEILDGEGAVAARGRSVMVFLDDAGTATVPIPTDIREVLERECGATA